MAAAVRGLNLTSTSGASTSYSRSLPTGNARRIHTRNVSRLVLFAVLADAPVEKKEVRNVTTGTDSVLVVDAPAPKPVLGLSDTNLKSTLEHRLWLAFGASAVTGMLAKAVTACHSPEEALQVGAGILAAYVLSDLGTGFYHWGVDNYGDATTPVFGAQIDAFQGHHQRPWTITKREFANNLHAIARPAGMFLTPFLLLPSQPLVDSFLGTFLGLVVMSQHIHALSHMKKSQLPKSVIALQDAGILLGRKMHGTHHKPPYDVNYCIVSGLWNPFLNEARVFKRLERWIYNKWGVAPRAWSETSDEWLQADTYFEDGTEFDPTQSS